MSRKQRGIYLAGPMSGIKDYNFPAFQEIARGLEDMGWAVHNPATSYNGSMSLPYNLYMSAAINMLFQADAIALMKGWEHSRGAKMEALIAQRIGLPFYNAHTGRRLQVAEIQINRPIVIDEGNKPFPKNEALLRKLIPVAKQLAAGNRDGITVTDIRMAALARGILTGEEHPNQLSVLGHICRRAGLINSGQTRRSELEVTHGIRQVVWYEDLARA